LRRRTSRDHLVAGASLLFALSLAILGLSQQVWLVAAAMVMNGAAWIAVLSSLFTVAQLALPSWVRARGLAAFMAVFMGSMAGGSLLWGHVAGELGIARAMLIAAVAMAFAVLLTRRFGLGIAEGVDLSPSLHWPVPMQSEGIAPDRGPVMVTVEYRIDPRNTSGFLALLREMRRVRRRDGAFFWETFIDAADPARVLEVFMVESWLEHLRQHERITVEDRLIQERLRACHQGPGEPVIAHFAAGGGPRGAGRAP
jgi:MFS family permease